MPTANKGEQAADVAGSHVAALIELQLEDEQARKASLTQRGASLITTSGTLVTILSVAIGVFRYSPHGGHHALPAGYVVPLFGFLLVAFALGIGANIPRCHVVADEREGPEGLRSLLEPDAYWAPEDYVTRRIALERLDELTALRRVNSATAKLVQAGQYCQLASLSFAALVVLVSLS